MSATTTAYVLVSPGGLPVWGTLALDKHAAEGNAYSELQHTQWAQRYWKQWDAFIAERERRGWLVRKCRVEVVE